MEQDYFDTALRPFNYDAEFLGQAIFPSVRALTSMVSNRLLKILEELGVEDPRDDQWYSVNISTRFYNRLIKEYGPNTVYDLGKVIKDYAVFPPNITNFPEALGTLHLTYELNHRNGYLGFYRMISHDEAAKEIVFQSYSPYPYDMDRGLITGLGRKFANTVRVYPMDNKPSKQEGGNESWFRIQYT